MGWKSTKYISRSNAIVEIFKLVALLPDNRLADLLEELVESDLGDNTSGLFCHNFRIKDDDDNDQDWIE